jgi:hypothetical protein
MNLAWHATDKIHAHAGVIDTRISQAPPNDHAIAVDTEMQLPAAADRQDHRPVEPGDRSAKQPGRKAPEFSLDPRSKVLRAPCHDFWPVAQEQEDTTDDCYQLTHVARCFLFTGASRRGACRPTDTIDATPWSPSRMHAIKST